METPDDEVTHLILRILELRSKVNSQVERLNKALTQADPPPDGSTSGHQTEPEEPTWRVERREPQDLRSAFKAFMASSPPLSEPREEWIPEAIRGDEFLHGERSQCRECRYKEGLEEILNILAVCGLIRRRDASRRDDQDESGLLQAHLVQGKRHVSSAFYY